MPFPQHQQQIPSGHAPTPPAWRLAAGTGETLARPRPGRPDGGCLPQPAGPHRLAPGRPDRHHVDLRPAVHRHVPAGAARTSTRSCTPARRPSSSRLTACLIGIALGQLLLGPVSDRTGRRLPLLVGLAAFVLSSLACAVAPNIYFLTGFRLIQGLGGAAGIVISRSIVRDLHSGVALARFFATLMLATGVGPVLAPQIGSWILDFTSWRGVFVVLAVFGVLLLFSAWWRVPGDPARRQAPDRQPRVHAADDGRRDP